MLGYLIRRSAAAALLLALLLTLIFFLLHLAPGEPELLLLDPEVPRSQQDRLRRIWGLDRPLPEQYIRWIGALVLRGEWGDSFSHGRPVSQVIGGAIPRTLLLTSTALLVQFGLGVSLGALAAAKPRSRLDRGIRLATLTLYAVPIFWLCLISLLLFSYVWPLFPGGHMRSVGAAGLGTAGRLWDLLHHLALPALVLGVSAAGAVARHARVSLAEVLSEPWVTTARAKGLSPTRVLWVHALPNAAPPLLELLGLSLPLLFSGALIVEVIFSWPGMGRIAYDALVSRDYPLILAATALSGVLVLLGTLVADLLQAAIDPRVRDEIT